MPFPDKVKIGWRTYKIEQGEHRAGNNGGDLLGEIAYYENKIYIYDKLSDIDKYETLLHEIIHGCLWLMGSELRDNERFITALTQHLFQVLKENPGLFSEVS